jgi:adenosylcobyric acid synthase
LGVVPFVRGLQIADEDSQSIDERRRMSKVAQKAELDIVVLRLPRMSNHDDVLSLEHESGVLVRFVDDVQDLNDGRDADLLILPGSKNTVSDLAWLRERGFDRVIAARAQRGQPVLGICGGCQMLGESIEDPDAVESTQARVEGLGLLALRTRFSSQKITAQVTAHAGISNAATFLTRHLAQEQRLVGYEIHQGVVHTTSTQASVFEMQRLGSAEPVGDGVADAGGNVVGTMIHGLLDNDALRQSLLQELRARRGLPTPTGVAFPRADEIDRLAAQVQGALDMDGLDRIVGFVPSFEPIQER